MRPIDADALKELYDFPPEYAEALHVPIPVVVQSIIDMPTLDLAPVVHGEWVKDGGCECRCKKCGYAPLYDYFGRVRLSNYCPNCGAKMDGGKTNGRETC